MGVHIVSERIVIPQIETLRKLREELYPYLLTKEEFDALTDVIKHFDACVDCILLTENDNAGYQPPPDRTERSDGSRPL